MQPLIRPSNWFYLVGWAMILVGGLAAYQFHRGRIVAVANGLTPIVVPGSAELKLTGPAHGTIFVEHRSSVGTQIFVTQPGVSGLQCTLTSPDGEELPLATAWIAFTYDRGLRAGQALYDFKIPRSGTYRLNAVYPQGAAGSSLVLAVGHGYLGDLSAPIIGGLAAVAGGVFGGLLWTVAIWRMRQRHRRRIYGRFA